MSDERDSAGSAGTGNDAETDGVEDTRGQTAVVTRPLRPTGKRTRRAAVETDAESDAVELTESAGTENGSGKAKKKTAKKEPGRYPNPFLFVVNYIKQVVAELRKVIWPNRKQMVSYTTVVLVFLAFMVTLIAGFDYGLARLVGLVFGE
ncbi:preprotein translocase subunit SecE [Mycolicibacterium litorale]|uniref:Protein translocase subunit SecE n=1 Tax=Mycolicibacterium litorale TaxID=758802 RepID=A0AAD1MV71_9MYCO|nr:preprotein translocase subunit SecE [Mycolicibacterium litorale]MCV7416438.1 preprotein translocase subunit SecE [Mycolicibacterium litorale]TDY09692.1 protein translocase subunit secE/sec61 gamma [Mycolicibacterium litorale]BBY17638.1 protein translocase subunit SecE [Mycolicibacterium litorale]